MIKKLIRRILGRCPECGGKLYWWSVERAYCEKCDWRIYLPF